MKIQSLCFASLLVLAGCAQGGGRLHEHNLRPGIVPSVDRFSVDAAERLCRADEVERERTALLDEAMSYGHGSAPATDLVQAFVSDVNANYRVTTAACQNYAMCMHQMGYNEGRCEASRDTWEDSMRQFERLNTRLAHIRENVATVCESCEEDVYLDGPPPASRRRPGMEQTVTVNIDNDNNARSNSTSRSCAGGFVWDVFSMSCRTNRN